MRRTLMAAPVGLLALSLLAGCPKDKEKDDNHAPGAAAVAIHPDEPRTDDDLVAVIETEAEDEDGDELEYRYVWTRDGVVQEDWAGDTVPASATSKGEVWAVTVTASDDEAEGEGATASVTIANGAPEVVDLALSPEAPSTDSLLSASFSTMDADGDEVSLTWSWTVDGDEVADTETLDGGSFFSKDQEVILTLIPDDGESDGEPVSVAVTIANSPPGAPTLRLGPADARAGEALLCEVVEESEDPDGDPVSYRFDWSVDGSAAGGASDAETQSELPEGLTLEGEVWTCAATPDDGEEEGTPAEATLTVLSTCETAVAYTLTSVSRSEKETVNAYVVDADADGYEDVLFVNQLSSSVTLWWGGASGPHEAESTLSMSRVGYGADVGDIDGDGDMEVIASNQDYSQYTIAWGNGARSWSGTTTLSQTGFPQGVTLLDADRDGDLDLVSTLGSGWVGVSGDNCTIVRLNDGTGNFAASGGCWLTGDTYAKRAADLDGDGWEELVASGTGEAWSSASGSLSSLGPLSLGLSDTGNAIYADDTDDDGDVDLVVADGTTMTLTTHLNDGTGAFRACDTSETLTAWPHDVGDLDADGDLDFASVSTCGYCSSTFTLGLQD